MQSSLIRTRWAAIGAAVAVSLGAGGIGITQATTSTGEMPIYIPIEPCRLADTRPAPDTIGPRATPLGTGETYTLSGWGTVGDCSLPNATTGLSLNATGIGATLPTFVTLYPADSTLPTASHLNLVPGQPPTPNAVNVDLDTTGEFSIYNLQGNVNIIIDVVGYYDDHTHRSIDLVDEPGVASNNEPDNADAPADLDAVLSTEIRVPADGFVVVQVSGHWICSPAGATAWCQLQKGAPAVIETSTQDPWIYLNAYDDPGEWRIFSSHRLIPIAAADNPSDVNNGQTISFVCDLRGGDVNFDDLHITAAFYPTSYAP